MRGKIGGLTITSALGVQCEHLEILAGSEGNLGVKHPSQHLSIREQSLCEGLELLLHDGEARQDEQPTVAKVERVEQRVGRVRARLVDEARLLAKRDEDFFYLTGAKADHFLQHDHVVVLKKGLEHVGNALVLVPTLVVGIFGHDWKHHRVEIEDLNLLSRPFLVTKYHIFRPCLCHALPDSLSQFLVKWVNARFDVVQEDLHPLEFLSHRPVFVPKPA